MSSDNCIFHLGRELIVVRGLNNNNAMNTVPPVAHRKQCNEQHLDLEDVFQSLTGRILEPFFYITTSGNQSEEELVGRDFKI